MLQINATDPMEMQVLVSKKGTKVVTATNLHQVLDLPNHHFATNVRKWLNDIYEFRDGIRSPIRMRDYAVRKNKENPILDDYYLSVEFAKLIALNSRSKVKQKCAKWLYAMEDPAENAEVLTKDQVLAVMEITKAMGLVSCQEASERRHMEVYSERNGGNAGNWWKHRAEVLGYSLDHLRRKVKRLGKQLKGQSQRQLLMQVDKYEMVRAGVIDLFMAMGKNERYARKMGDLAKIFARELKVDIHDDRESGSAFTPQVNQQLVNEVKTVQRGGILGLW